MDESSVVGIHVCGAEVRRAESRRSGRKMEILGLERQRHESQNSHSADAPNGQVDAGPGLPSKGTEGNGPDTDPRLYTVSLPASDVMSRCWTFPAADEARIKQMAAHRLEADLPLPIDQLVWDWRKVGSSGKDRVDVLAQAAKAERVATERARLEALGIRVDILTTETEALGALYRYGLKHPDGPGTEVLILAEPDQWLVAVFAANMIRSVRRVRVASGQLELACSQCRQSVEVEVPVHELRRVLWCASPEVNISPQDVSRMMGCAVEPAEPVEHLVDTEGQTIGADRLAVFGPAIGLSLAGLYERSKIIRLAEREQLAEMPHHRLIQHIAGHPWRWTASAAAFLILAAVIHIGAIRSEAGKMRRLLNQSDQTKSLMAELDPKYRAMQRLEKYRIDVEGIFADLCRPIPAKMVISSIQLSRGRRLVIKGTTKDAKAIAKLADALRESGRFAAVYPERVEPARGGGFTISADLVQVKPFPSIAGGTRRWR